MRTLVIPADDTLVETLEKLAQADAKTLETLIQDVLLQYARQSPIKPEKYSFIGIGRSGKGTLSTQVDEALGEGASRREGWSLPT